MLGKKQKLYYKQKKGNEINQNLANIDHSADIQEKNLTLLEKQMIEMNGKLSKFIDAQLNFMQEIRNELAGIKSELGGIKSEIVGIKSEIVGIKSEIVGIKSELGGMNQKFNRFEGLEDNNQEN
ncbi:hypothetical protein TTHERM_01070310 (macronuclear) [Tetrahymena thermophila SB210]|uniref:Uncharacterized protein n=1 Tax=Tetrahymena thermophila (strain SB210) TaxID=312017 RepID=Q24FR0_TETTS|nr:hypothetical protein TTHERM_01070310 [Tetrahymena thermophila SB210]EAS06584.1 hypothetical protein TTHERM_01070310 [Tetrahymena thermophila SB210]|eukprot:XP_001026829.1 hypothetical protein TTHERM_01070310 [Tetrahymena thermophila SB210]